MVDARLHDGSRVNVIFPPLSIDSPCISIRKFSRQRLDFTAMVENGTMSAEVARLLGIAARCRLNVLISGGTGSGKTTLLNAMSQMIDNGERIISVEDAAELQLRQPHVIRLETRPHNLEGQGAVSQRELLRNALRMRPDRIILGEVRGEEAFDMLQAMNTGHDGSISTVHANTARDALTRIENMVQMGTFNLPSRAIRSQIVGAIDLIVQVERMRDGVRRVTPAQRDLRPRGRRHHDERPGGVRVRARGPAGPHRRPLRGRQLAAGFLAAAGVFRPRSSLDGGDAGEYDHARKPAGPCRCCCWSCVHRRRVRAGGGDSRRKRLLQRIDELVPPREPPIRCCSAGRPRSIACRAREIGSWTGGAAAARAAGPAGWHMSSRRADLVGSRRSSRWRRCWVAHCLTRRVPLSVLGLGLVAGLLLAAHGVRLGAVALPCKLCCASCPTRSNWWSARRGRACRSVEAFRAIAEEMPSPTS